MKKYFGENYCTDLEITPPANTEGTFQGAHVWVTLIGDGGFSINNNNVANALCYYTYTGNLTADDAQTIHKTIIYPNTNTKRRQTLHRQLSVKKFNYCIGMKKAINMSIPFPKELK